VFGDIQLLSVAFGLRLCLADVFKNGKCLKIEKQEERAEE